MLALCAVLALSAAAHAQTRFIASNGNDANNCSRGAPCRTLQRGVDAATAGSELQILDSSAYGGATLGRSITISADGVSATVGRITINNANATVVLRGLLATGRGLAANTNGIQITAARAVHIVGCQIERFPGHGIVLSTADVALFVSDSILRDNGADGLNLSATGIGDPKPARLVIDNSRFENNGGDGLEVAAIETTITRAVVSGNGGNGVGVSGGGRLHVAWTTAASNVGSGYLIGGGSQATLESVGAHGNANAGVRLFNLASNLVRISNSVLTNNLFGIQNVGGTVLTRENNTVTGNGTNVSGAFTPLGGT